MTFITDFADQAVILPLVIVIAATLLIQGWRRGAMAWALAIVVTFSVMLMLKLFFLACVNDFAPIDIRTPSGHVAAATVITGGLAALLLNRARFALPLAILAATVIGISRLTLGLHSLPEVLLGASIGLLGALLLQKLAGHPPPGLNVRRIGLVAAVVVLVFHGFHLPAEAHIRSTASRIARILAVCEADQTLPYVSSNRTISSSPR